MNRGIIGFTRRAHDGSVYFQQRVTIGSKLREIVALILLIVIPLLLLKLAHAQSPLPTLPATDHPATRSTVNGVKFPIAETGPPEDAAARKAGIHETTTLPSLWPLRGRLTDGFGDRRNPFRRRSSEFHPGQDIAALWGTPVSVTADGTVVFAGSKKGYGRMVIVDHGNNISTRYGHLSRIDTTVGALISRGEQIGLVGSTGRSTGPHLHYEVRVGQVPVNPLVYLPVSSDPRRSL